MVKVVLHKTIDESGNVVLRDRSRVMDVQSIIANRSAIRDQGFRAVADKLLGGFNPRKPLFLYMVGCDPTELEQRQIESRELKRQRRKAGLTGAKGKDGKRLGVNGARKQKPLTVAQQRTAVEMGIDAATAATMNGAQLAAAVTFGINDPLVAMLKNIGSMPAVTNHIGASGNVEKRFMSFVSSQENDEGESVKVAKSTAPTLFNHKSWFIYLTIHLRGRRNFSAHDCRSMWRSCTRKVPRRVAFGVNFALHNHLPFYFSKELLDETKFPMLENLRNEWNTHKARVRHCGHVLMAVPLETRDRDWRGKMCALLSTVSEYGLDRLHTDMVMALEFYEAGPYASST